MAFPLHITGFVEYTPKGDIIIEAEGVEEHLEKFIARLKTYVQPLKVSDFSIVEISPKGYLSFEIRYGTNLDDTAVNRPFAVRYLLIVWMRIRRMFESNKQSSRPGEFHPQPLTEPYVKVSRHTALPDRFKR